VISLRDALPEDATAIAEVHIRSWQLGYQELLPRDYLESLRPEDRAARYQLGPRQPGGPLTVVALDGQQNRGFVTTGDSRDDDVSRVGEIFAMYVNPSHWGRGIGRLLIEQARSNLCETGYVEALLWVLDGNERARRFYVADGWAPDGSRREEDVWGVRVTVNRYRRPLL
jgi:GNAT superfamily N-acetyltransferase